MTLAFTNPATESAYRLRQDSPTWRIIKSRTHNGAVVVRNLAGVEGDDDVDPRLLDLLVRGEKSIPRAVGNAQRAFVVIVLMDLDRTYQYVVALARDAEVRSQRGYPGFRPNSPQVRRDAAAAKHTALVACACMAEAWKNAGLVAANPLPTWMVAALSDSPPA